ncbi:Formimidoyltransferase-cyclodeaminase (Includes: Glutamate formimidoyltransferase; Formimidoyltetrahydrofolate cyclodeaminase) [Desulfamplus magnetovallimortis]|uniref:Formimidoyltransferase-cyclodeaminase n=1 Tax=Desulfamplus magnetovallimortis TaxID=1246637 RepID=A0A1W1HBF1_9BACT|nr:glutamate formimidoyltransferase [Desulfamplus magnetovallimortis]SLM29817.1 Formimidoyltransferase-cyclodeaminase (Includes: Glutamate formimidoyltransferase; Formimidoyltetrahydrofolate cyclodeaminase) [Desulfamplus magnetovallimortis]
MKKIVECVPNFSEGRDRDVINAIADAISKTEGCTLLDVDPGKSTHRTVYTFVGDPESVIEGALAAARVAFKRIDMRKHKGEHPRFGAMDVCPFIPVAGVTMEECAKIAKKFAQRAAEALNVPFFLYEEAAEHEYRRKLPDVRKGEYEALEERLKDPKWKPDFGPASFVPTWGATATGARMFLIAYNVNILGTSNQAHRIALNLREAGRGEDEPGRMKDVKGMGWFVDEYNMAQVTVNLNNYHVTAIHELFESVKEEAAALNVGVAGSEIVGIVPLESLIMAADYYIEKENLFIYEEDQKVRLAIERLGLNSVAPFNPKEKVIEYIVAEPPDEPLASLSVRGFIEEIAARTSAPGGGSASAAMAAIGTGLGSMVAKLTYGVRKFENVDAHMRKHIPLLHDLTQKLIPMIDADTSAFNEYMEGLRMPRGTDEEKAERHAKMQAGLKTAINVPLTTMRLADAAWDALCEVARYGNPASKSDVQVGAKALETGIWGAYQNVLINMEDVEDEAYKSEILKESEAIEKRAREKCSEVLSLLG